jgi:hypothetical protein
MRPMFPRSSSFAFLTLLAACAGGPSPNFATSEYSPMPMGETARNAAPIAVTQAMAEEILVVFTDRNGRRREVGFRCSFATDSAHELLAMAAARHNLAAAHGQARNVLCTADLDSFVGIEACQEQLRSRLDEVLFPCGIDGVQARLTGVEWSTWDVR